MFANRNQPLPNILLASDTALLVSTDTYLTTVDIVFHFSAFYFSFSCATPYRHKSSSSPIRCRHRIWQEYQVHDFCPNPYRSKKSIYPCRNTRHSYTSVVMVYKASLVQK